MENTKEIKDGINVSNEKKAIKNIVRNLDSGIGYYRTQIKRIEREDQKLLKSMSTSKTHSLQELYSRKIGLEKEERGFEEGLDALLNIRDQIKFDNPELFENDKIKE